MLYIGIVETLQYVSSEFLSTRRYRQVQRLHQFIELHFADILADDRMIAGVTHNVYAGEIGHRRKYGVRAVQQGNLFFHGKGASGLHEEHVQSGFVCVNLSARLREREVLGSFR